MRVVEDDEDAQMQTPKAGSQPVKAILIAGQLRAVLTTTGQLHWRKGVYRTQTRCLKQALPVSGKIYVSIARSFT